MRTLTAFLVVLLMSGCCRRAVWWSRPGAIEREFYAEYAACERDTAPEWGRCTGGARIGQEKALRERWARCMRSLGWVPQDHCRERSEAAQTFRPVSSQ